MVEGVYLASFALSALSWGLSLFLMAYEWNPRIYLIFLWCSHSPLAQITMSHHFLFLLHLPSGSAQAVCLMSACSTILSKQWISRLLKITPKTVWVTNYPHRRIPLPLSFFIIWLSRRVSLSHSLGVPVQHKTFSQRESQHHYLWDHVCLTIFIHGTRAKSGNGLLVLYTSYSFSRSKLPNSWPFIAVQIGRCSGCSAVGLHAWMDKLRIRIFTLKRWSRGQHMLQYSQK